MSTAKKSYTVAEVVTATGIGKRSLEDYINRGDLVVRYVGAQGGARLILEADLDAFLANLPTQKPAKAAS